VTAGVSIAGNSILAGLLSRQFGMVGDWKVVLDGPDPPCSNPGPVACWLVEPTLPVGASSQYSKTLHVSAPTQAVALPLGSTQVPTGSVELAGQLTATRNGAIAAVSTLLGLCQVGSNCFIQGNFTGHTLPAPISVAAGQIVQASVILSFN
jgi:hypothetical protein